MFFESRFYSSLALCMSLIDYSNEILFEWVIIRTEVTIIFEYDATAIELLSIHEFDSTVTISLVGLLFFEPPIE